MSFFNTIRQNYDLLVNVFVASFSDTVDESDDKSSRYRVFWVVQVLYLC